ncbi:MAG: hypothetical protein ACOYVJ_04165 [Nitrospirota bacterium]
MALSGKYGKINILNIGDDESVFILRAQDKFAAAAIRMYKALAQPHGSPVVKDLEEMINTFLHWNGTKKIPD